MHTTNCNWTRIENFMQIHPRQARSGYELIRGGMYLTVALIRYMSMSLQNLFRWLNLGFEQHSPLTHSLTKGITHTAYALCSAVIDFVKHECINCFIAAPSTRRNNEGSHGSVHDFKVYRSWKVRAAKPPRFSITPFLPRELLMRKCRNPQRVKK